MTSLRIEDEEGGRDKLNENIAAGERAAGRPLRNIVARLAIKF